MVSSMCVTTDYHLRSDQPSDQPEDQNDNFYLDISLNTPRQVSSWGGMAIAWVLT